MTDANKLDELEALLSELPTLTVVQHCKAGGEKPVDTVKLNPIQRRALGSMERQHGEAIVAAVNWCRDEGITLARQSTEQAARVAELEGEIERLRGPVTQYVKGYGPGDGESAALKAPAHD